VTTARGRRRRGSLRVRVALAAAGAIVVAVAVLGAGVQLLLSNHLHGTLDSTLHERAAEIAQISATAPALLTSPGVLDVSAGPRLVDVEVVDRQGRIVARSLGLHGQTIRAARLVAAAVHRGRSGYADARLDGGEARLYVAPLPDLGGPAGGGAVIVAASTDDVADTLEQSRRLILGGALLAAALAFPLSLVLARRALRPLDDLTSGAAVIERTGDASLRLPAGDSQTAGEVARLTETLNRMLHALEQAREAERRFVADASHELRNPVTALRGNAAYLVGHGGDAEALADLHADVERLSALLDDLLALAREDAEEAPEGEVSLEELAREAADRDPGVVVEADGPGLVRGDRGSLERALRNLVANAHAYGPAGGLVRLGVETAPGAVALSVTDAGHGIPRDLVDDATGRFWRGENADGAGGSGLGLSLVRAAAERHGGRLEIDGPRFAIVLPALMPLSGPAEQDAGASTRRHQ
jgi:two-component system, OmpR family, sensor kinase